MCHTKPGVCVFETCLDKEKLSWQDQDLLGNSDLGANKCDIKGTLYICIFKKVKTLLQPSRVMDVCIPLGSSP